jgi:flagellar biosynthesis protein FlhG
MDSHTLTCPKTPRIWAVGGGKGGVGKSLIGILLSLELAGKGQRTVLVDADLGGANIHTLMGVRTPSRTLNDFVTRKYASIEEICIHTSVDHLQLVCGASEILSLANPQYAQKNKILQGLLNLPVQNVILDLGAGTSYNVLDFFLIAQNAIIVVTPQPISIQNAYGFVRNAVYRKLSRMANQQAALQNLIKTAMDPKNEKQMRTIHDLYAAVHKEYGKKMVLQIQESIGEIKPIIVTNMAKNHQDKNAGRIIQLVAEKYLTIQAQNVGAVSHDPIIETMVSRMTPLSQLPMGSQARTEVAEIVNGLCSTPSQARAALSSDAAP